MRRMRSMLKQQASHAWGRPRTTRSLSHLPMRLKWHMTYDESPKARGADGGGPVPFPAPGIARDITYMNAIHAVSDLVTVVVNRVAEEQALGIEQDDRAVFQVEA